MIQNIYVRVGENQEPDYTPYKSSVSRVVRVTQIPVKIEENDNDWEYVLINAGDGVKRLAVF